MSEYKDIFEPDFIEWFNKNYANFALSIPDPTVEPCFGSDGKVKRRGEWDIGPTFSADKKSTFQFMKHQLLIREFLTNDAPYRGILLYHGLGSGKTLTSQAVSENMKDQRQVIVMTPASLRENFIAELKKGGQYESVDKAFRAEVLRKYYFISYDASNAPQQVKLIPDELNHKLLIIDEVHNLISMIKSQSVKGTFMFDAIMNATDLKIVMLSGTPIINDPFELGIIANLLVGYLDNKGRRHIRPSIVEDRYKLLLFENNIDFWYHFVDATDPEKLSLKNPLKLKRRITGLISYYAGLQPREKILPKATEHFVFTEMSRRQFDMYDKVRTLERESEKKFRRRMGRQSSGTPGSQSRQMVNLNALFSTSAEDTVLSNFRSTSRQFCNFAFPFGIPRYVKRLGDVNALKDDKSNGSNSQIIETKDTGIDSPDETEKFSAEINKIHAESLKMIDDDHQKYLVDELPINSSKMNAMMRNIQASRGPVYVYSQFRRLEGIGIFSRVLKAHGFIEFGWGHDMSDFSKHKQNMTKRDFDNSRMKWPMHPLPHTRDAITGRLFSSFTDAEKKNMSIYTKFTPLTYLIWPRSTGNALKRNFLLNVFNCEENKKGNLIRVFLSTKAGAEGINLMNVRQVDIMEPYWNEMRIKQAIGRAIRQCSHASLPPQERTVDIYHYVSTIKTHVSEDISASGSPESSDEYVRQIANNKQQVIDKVEKLMKEVAIDCKLNRAHNGLVDHDIACFEPTIDVYKSFSVDLSQDPSDAEILGDRRIMRVALERIRLPMGQFRISSEDRAILQQHIKTPDRIPGKPEIDIYALDSVLVVYKLKLDRGKPIRFMKVP